MANIFRRTLNLFFPRCCSVCGKALSDVEQYLCMECLAGLPRLTTGTDGRMQEADALFLGCKTVEAAVACFHYNRQSRYSEILKDIKYRNRPDMGRFLARQFASRIADYGFFNGIDMIVPVPLHKSKLRRRGYNQSLYIAKGISDVTGLEVEEALQAVKPHSTQTHMSPEERRRNVEGVFAADDNVRGKKLLLVDDVITTGATLTVCCDVLEAAGAVSVKILSLAFASTV